MTNEVIAIDAELLLEFMDRLGQPNLACGEQMAEVERLLRRTAAAFGTLVGASLHKGLGERFGWWRLQVRRVKHRVEHGRKRLRQASAIAMTDHVRDDPDRSIAWSRPHRDSVGFSTVAAGAPLKTPVH
jgi:hypothetical protein